MPAGETPRAPAVDARRGPICALSLMLGWRRLVWRWPQTDGRGVPERRLCPLMAAQARAMAR
eukprot:405117-Lingulodinium_polyedra.AAC.1